MATNLALDDRLIDQAVKAGKHKTKREAVNAALEEYIRLKKLQNFDDLLGKVDYYDEVTPKAMRKRKTA